MLIHDNINKEKMINDIVLTVSLILSVILVRIIMTFINADISQYKNAVFFISTFIVIKILYNVMMRIIRKFIIK